MMKDKKIGYKQFIWGAVFLCYFIGVFRVTLIGRTGIWQNNTIMPLFYSYKDAWVNFSITAWKNIILNICMFVPLGILLPIGMKCFRNFLKTSLAGLVVTIFIEGFQLVMHLGMFELDDLLNNTVGAMIGYGIYALIQYSKKRIKKEVQGGKSLLTVLALQLPFVLTIVVFTIIFISYKNQELGNIKGQYIVKYDADKIHVSAREEYSKEHIALPVYAGSNLSKEETIKFANEFFQVLETKIDESKSKFYEETAVFEDVDKYSLWVDYRDGSYQLTDFQTTFSEEPIAAVTDADEKEIREALLRYGVEVPKEAGFEMLDTEKYEFRVDQLVENNTMTDGALICGYYDNGCFSEINNHIITCQLYKEFQAISEQEAYNKICSGEFVYYGSEEVFVEVGECKMEYVMDSKGYYQPIYVFSCNINDEQSEIRIPAIQ